MQLERLIQRVPHLLVRHHLDQETQGAAPSVQQTQVDWRIAEPAAGGNGKIDGVTNPGPEVPGDAAIKDENAKVDAKVKSICKGC